MIQKLTHPSHEVEKTYRVLIARWPIQSEIIQLLSGVKCKDYVGKALRVSRLGPQPVDKNTPVLGYWIEMVMGEGRKREIREMLAAVRIAVHRLVRISHGPVAIGNLKPGEIRMLNETESSSLRELSANP